MTGAFTTPFPDFEELREKLGLVSAGHVVEDDHAGHDHKRKRRAIDMSTVLEPGTWVRFLLIGLHCI